MTTTYALDRSRSVSVCKSVMIAASVEPVGRNANWSENVNDGGGLRKTGYKKLRTTDRSMILVRIRVMKMGRKSATSLGDVVLGIGQMLASFHCSGTVDVTSDRLNREAIDRQKTGAATRRNQAGRPSRPIPIGRRLSSALNTYQSDTNAVSVVVVDCFLVGAV